MFHSIVKSTTAGATSIAGNLRGFPATHLIVSKATDWHASDRLVVQVSTDNGPKNLVPSLPLQFLAARSAFLYGQNHTSQALINALTATAISPTIEDFLIYTAVVDLGALRNDVNDSTLEIQLQAGEAATYSVAAAFLDAQRTDEFVSFIQSNQLQGSFANCRRLWLYTATDVDTPYSGVDLNAIITSDYGAGLVNAPDLFGATFGLGSYDFGYQARAVLAYSDPNEDLPGNVTYQLTGAQASSYIAIGECVELDRARVSNATINGMRIMEKRLSQKGPSQGKAYVRAGRGMKLSDIAARLRAANVKK